MSKTRPNRNYYRDSRNSPSGIPQHRGRGYIDRLDDPAITPLPLCTRRREASSTVNSYYSCVYGRQDANHIGAYPRPSARARVAHLASPPLVSLSLSLMHPPAGSPPAAPLLSLSRRGVRLPTAPAARRASSHQASPLAAWRTACGEMWVQGPVRGPVHRLPGVPASRAIR